MITDTHKRAIKMWVFSKLNNSDINPSVIILNQLTGESPPMTINISDTVQLCQKINEIKGLPDLKEEEIKEIQKYGVHLMISNEGSKNVMLAKALWVNWVNWAGYLLGAISIGIGSFNWWILVFSIGTWWAYGATKIAIQKQSTEHRPTWEKPAHIIIHILALSGLIGSSVFNLIK